jgi:hypothetical protein
MTASIDFERNIAAILRTLGAYVEHDTELAGNQVDVLITESTPSGVTVRTAIECKAFRKQVGLGTTNFYAQLSQLLKQRNLIEKFAIVALSGFTKNARKAGNEHGLQLIEYADLQTKVAGREVSVKTEETRIENDQARGATDVSRKKRIFAVMPFSREFDDVFFLGIQDVGQKLGLVVERADLIEHNEEIVSVISDRISRASVVVGDITNGNANVHYELGLAHAKHIPTILIMRAGGEVPFDLRNFNVMFYENVTHLREMLTRRLQAVLNLHGTESLAE